ncbi:YitT family protein [Roseibium limicola]|uniref:YitT family protein n=1 Tax=Roseibium limicola TaxID=2816037 RepID=A0A939EMW5_9HYPH|nr:YitT family protein [Roseibium limicola]MBO0344223.1 YitT family protein [Roseibium limicola]
MSSPDHLTPEKVSPTHTLLDNLQGQVFGIVMTAFGVTLLRAAGLVTGQTAGMALLISYASGYSFGVIFFLINIPFYIFAWMRMGPGFTLRSLISATLISILADFAPQVISFAELNIYAAGLLAGATAGVGLIALFRHGASAGGLGILALYIQDRTGFRAGWVQLSVDVCIFAASFLVLAPSAVGASLFGALVLNVIIAFNHRKDWYIAH